MHMHIMGIGMTMTDIIVLWVYDDEVLLNMRVSDFIAEVSACIQFSFRLII